MRAPGPGRALVRVGLGPGAGPGFGPGPGSGTGGGGVPLPASSAAHGLPADRRKSLAVRFANCGSAIRFCSAVKSRLTMIPPSRAYEPVRVVQTQFSRATFPPPLSSQSSMFQRSTELETTLCSTTLCADSRA